jgi:pSer/pThr/pTyr-binding forkhead associated (FHA) protein
MPFCTRCGHANPEDSRFCGECGASLLAADTTSTVSLQGFDTESEADPTHLGSSEHEALEMLPAGSALLVVRRGPNSGSRFILNADVTTVGRHPDSDIFLDDVTVSRRHAEFARDGEAVLVRDVGSLNGTYVNRERIDSAALSSGDEVQIGKYRLAYMTHMAAGTGLLGED